ncbi:MAG: dihydrofolate reductase [Cycloclasticus sp.]|nr:dihydrofolate reductase [Cycloclasticus sp.]
MIVAMADNRAIGKGNELLWHLPDDFKHFKAITMAKPILMGRKTYQSIGRPLPGRKNIVVTRDAAFTADGVLVVNSIDAALDAVKEEAEVMVIGGASFYQQMLPLADRLYVTHVHHHFDADTFFPEIDADQWRLMEQTEHAADKRHAFSFSFIEYQKI